MRPMNCFLLAMCAIVGMFADKAEEAFEHWPTLIMVFIGAWALSAAAMVLNDYFDIEIDKINAPDRPIPAGKIKREHALIFGIILIVIGLLMSVGIDLYESLYWVKKFVGVSIITAIVCAIMLSIYSNVLKKYSILGNFAVSIGVWFGFLYGDLIFDLQLNWLPECMGFGAFILNFGREIAKGIIDVEGDRAGNVTTVATAFGPQWTANIAAFFNILAVGSTIIPIFLADASWLYLSTISISGILAIIMSVWIVIDQSEKSILKIKTIVLFVMLISLVSFTLESFFGDVILNVIAT